MSGVEAILSRDSYLLGMELKLFWAVAVVYGLAFLAFLFHLLSRSEGAGRAAQGVLAAGAFIHLVLVVFRTFETGRGPFESLYESLSFFAASTTIAYIFVSRRWRGVYLPGLVVSLVACGASLYALFTRSPEIGPLSPPLQSWWFEYHVTLAFLSYAVFTVGAAVEISYLFAKSGLRRGAPEAWGLTSGTLERFRSSAFRTIAFGYPLFTFTVFSGAAWANDAWGRYWSWDPKETWSLITWTVFTMYLHSMCIQRFRGLPASVLAIGGFACMMVTFLGINWLAKLLGIPSLHIYSV